jgi:hypothetical protein
MAIPSGDDPTLIGGPVPSVAVLTTHTWRLTLLTTYANAPFGVTATFTGWVPTVTDEIGGGTGEGGKIRRESPATSPSVTKMRSCAAVRAGACPINATATRIATENREPRARGGTTVCLLSRNHAWMAGIDSPIYRWRQERGLQRSAILALPKSGGSPNIGRGTAASITNS